MSLTFKNKKDIKINNVHLFDRYGLIAVESEINTTNAFGLVSNGTEFTIKFIRKPWDMLLPIIDETYYDTTLDKELNLLFFGEEDVMLDIGGKLYFAKAVDSEVTKYRYFDELNITFEMLSDCCYDYLTAVPLNGFGNTDVCLENDGIRDIDAEVYIESYKDQIITFTNKARNSFTVKLKEGECAKISCEDILGIDYDRVSGDVYETLRLEFGDNEIKIEVEDAFIKFYYQAEYGLC